VDGDASGTPGRQETVSVTDNSTVTNTTYNLTNPFDGGVYLATPISVPVGGDTVDVVVHNVAGPNAVISGLFIK